MSKVGNVATKATMFEYTNKLLPNKEDATWTRVAKLAAIVLSLGLALVVTATIDLTKKSISSVKSLFKKEEATQEKASEKPTSTKKEKAREITDDFIKGAKESFGNVYLIPKKIAKMDISMQLKASGISGAIFGKAALFAGIGYIGARNGALAAIGAGLAGTFSHSVYSHFKKD